MLLIEQGLDAAAEKYNQTLFIPLLIRKCQ